MIRIAVLFALTPCVVGAQHTFSIVAVDSVTGEVGSAGASCIGGSIGVDIISGITPGRGGINAQAYVCVPNVNLNNGIAWMNQGHSPQEVKDSLLANDACFSQNYDPAYRQYGIVAIDSNGHPQSAAHTGTSADNYKGHLTGPHYSIQGNILLGQEILDSMEARFLNTSGDLADKLMAALQGANVPGADTRCLAGGTSSLSAYIKVAKPTDTQGNFYLDIVLKSVPSGVEPIDTLQTRFDAWKIALGTDKSWDKNDVSVIPLPAVSAVSIITNDDRDMTAQFFDATGRHLKSVQVIQQVTTGTDSWPTGVVYYRVLLGQEIVHMGNFVKL